jgi:hypothetical protein
MMPILEGSHRRQQANEVGLLGEVIIEEFFDEHGINYQDERTRTTHDYTMQNGVTVDVKTKERTVRPQAHYDNSVPLYNHAHQRPDFYYFVSLMRHSRQSTTDLERFSEAHILGALSLRRLEQVGKYWKAGTTDPRNGTTFWTDCLNVSMAQLLENTEMTRIFKEVTQWDFYRLA